MRNRWEQTLTLNNWAQMLKTKSEQEMTPGDTTLHAYKL